MDIFKGLHISEDHDLPQWVVDLYAGITSELHMFMEYVDPNSAENMTKMMKTICADGMEIEIECPGGRCVQLAAPTLHGFYQLLRTFISTSLLENGWKSHGIINTIYIYVFKYIIYLQNIYIYIKIYLCNIFYY